MALLAAASRTSAGSALEDFRGAPVRFVRDVLRDDPQPWQVDAHNQVEHHHQLYAIAGATGVGKDRFLAQRAWYTLACKPYSKVLATSVSAGVLRNNLWGEMAELQRRSPLMQAMFEMGDRRIAARGPAGKRWFMVAKTAPARYSHSTGEVEAEGLAGFYARDTDTLIDEASGVHDAAFRAVLGSANTPTRRVIAVGNPLRGSGYLYDIFCRPRVGSVWGKRRVAYLDSILTNSPAARKIRDQWRRTYGKHSAYYVARALARFPSSDTINTIFTADEVALAMARFGDWLLVDDPSLPLSIGIDVARFGDDQTVWYARRGLVTLAMEQAGKTDGPMISDRATDMARRILSGSYVVRWRDYTTGEDHEHTPAAHPLASQPDFDPRRYVDFRIDVGGLAGLGPPDYMRRDGWRIADVNFGASASDLGRKRYANLGTEMWMDDLKRLTSAGSLYPDEVFEGQLVQRKYGFAGALGQLKLESKDDMRVDGRGSPDCGDAAALSAVSAAKIDLGLTVADWRSKLGFVGRRVAR